MSANDNQTENTTVQEQHIPIFCINALDRLIQIMKSTPRVSRDVTNVVIDQNIPTDLCRG